MIPGFPYKHTDTEITGQEIDDTKHSTWKYGAE